MLKIHKTTDYSQFKFLTKNRPVAPQYLIDSIISKNLLEEHPIICDINKNVIDGQNRLKAAEFLKLPIYYMISEKITADDIGTCQVQKPWTLSDFLRFFQDKEDYQFVHELIFLYKLPIHFVVYCCNQGSNIMRDFRLGTFEIKKDKKVIKQRMAYIKELMTVLIDLKRNAGEKDLNVSSRVQRALWTFVSKEDYNHKRMKEAIKNYPANVLPILGFNSEKMIWSALKDRVYNYKRQLNLMS